MKGGRKAWHYSKVGCLLTLNGGTAPVPIQCCADTWHYVIFVDRQYWKAVPHRCCTDAWHYSKVGCLPALNVGTALVLIQCCIDAWQYTNVGCLPALKSSTAPVLHRRLALLKSWLFACTECWYCAGADSVLHRCLAIHKCWLFASTGIIHGLQPERYRAVC